MSGDVNICDKNTGKELMVEAQDILDFVANYVRSKKISELEQMGTNDILKVGAIQYQNIDNN